MRIAYFVSEYPALSQTFIINQIAGIAEQGHEVHIYATHVNKKANCRLPLVLRQTGLVTYINDHPGGILNRSLTLARQLFSGNIQNNFVLVFRSLRFLLSQGLSGWVRVIERVLLIGDRGKYDIVHCQFATLWRVVESLFEVDVISGRLVVSVRGYDITTSRYTRFGAYDRFFDRAELFLPVCNSLKSYLLDLGCEKSKIRVHHSGIKVSSIKFRGVRNPKHPIKLLSVGRLVEKKGFIYVIKAIERLVNNGIDVECTIVGDGPLKPVLEKSISEYGVQHCVTLAGALSQDRTLELMENADIFLAPCVTASDGDQEGIPNVLKEAMALGVPVIATRHSGIPELIVHRESGLLVDERDDEGLANSVSAYLEMSHNDRQQMIGAARNKVESEYEIGDLIIELEGAYKAMLMQTGEK